MGAEESKHMDAFRQVIQEYHRMFNMQRPYEHFSELEPSPKRGLGKTKRTSEAQEASNSQPNERQEQSS